MTDQSTTNLAWIDMEMTGLNVEENRILEVAIVITNSDLEIVAQAPVLVIHQSNELLLAMDSWNQSMHSRSGLIDKVKASALTEEQATEIMLKFMRQHIPAGVSPMCGNSIGLDRRFLDRYMPELQEYFHYRNLDVSTLKELVKRWAPTLLKKMPEKSHKHEALSDVLASIEELKFYRDHFLTL